MCSVKSSLVEIILEIILLNSDVATEDKTDDMMGRACCTN